MGGFLRAIRTASSENSILFNPDYLIKMIKSSETVLTGKWLTSQGAAVADEICRRIHALTQNHLVELGLDANGWDTLYRDPTDGRFWELTYPQSGMQGGAPPQLRCLSSTEANAKYGNALNGELRPCPCCGSKVITTLGKYEICKLCGWEDDPVQFRDQNYSGGANKLSLNQARIEWLSRK